MARSGAEASSLGPVIDVLTRLASADFSACLERTEDGSENDTLAWLVNALAEELGDFFHRERVAKKRLESAVDQVTKVLLSLAAGAFKARLPPAKDHSALDLLASMVNSTAEKLESLFHELTSERDSKAAIVEAVADALVVLGEDGEILAVNAAAVRLLGYEKEELVGMPLSFFLAEGNLAMSGILHGAVRDHPLVFRGQSGERIPTLFSGSPLARGRRSEATWIVGLARDMREIYRLREQERQLTEELVKAAKYTASTLASSVAHEIRNPLQIICSTAQYLLQTGEASQDDRHDCLERVWEAAKRAERVIQTLLYYGLPPSGKRAAIGVNEILRKLESLVSKGFLANGVGYSMALAENLPPVVADEHALSQAFLNLVINARDAIVGEGTVQVKSALEDETVVVCISDTGVGISEENMAHLGEEFFTTKPAGKGVGLGLSICRKIIADHGGRCEFESKLGQGTEVKVVLPCLAAVPESEAR